MGLFSKILPALEGIAGVALMFVPGMQLAGAMLITSAAASSGLIGGSVGKFLNSGLGQGLMAAVALGSTAYAMYGGDALSAADEEAVHAAGAEYSAESSSIAQNAAVAQSAANTTGDLAAVPSAITQPTGVPTSGLATPGSAAAGGGSNVQQLNAIGSQNAMPEAVQADTQAVQTGAQPQVASGAQSTGNAANAGYTLNGPGGTTTPAPGGMAPDATTAAAQAANPSGAAADMEMGAGGGGAKGGLMSTLLNTRGGAAGIQAAGSLVGGIGQGITQKQTMQDQINAMQYATRSYGGQGGAQLAGAAAAPVTVPQGYLQRAQAIRALLQGNAGIQPAAGAPGTPAPVLGGTPAGGPVPVYAMGATPRGGVI